MAGVGLELELTPERKQQLFDCLCMLASFDLLMSDLLAVRMGG